MNAGTVPAELGQKKAILERARLSDWTLTPGMVVPGGRNVRSGVAGGVENDLVVVPEPFEEIERLALAVAAARRYLQNLS